ncbi:hypothetical protein CBR_g12879 [Chara braunii]|uniref:HAT C-terminal dimerisation domain-containing protein n=1 Tax=Chara braunii TaxID=69332 RepID=A0A388KSW6_CHABU|nr:hypothetical protein CBR_g12879 [Chara braunii]|eukprot:GBG73161.1 hypothetical protein CBR_g12879 [Chara braunii]
MHVDEVDDDIPAQGHKRRRQTTIDEVYDGNAQQQTRSTFLEWVYDAGIPFRAFLRSSWRRHRKVVAELPRGVRMVYPSHKEIGGSRVIEKRDQVATRLAPVNASFEAIGATILTDGRRSKDLRPIINFLAAGKHGALLYATVCQYASVPETGEIVLRRWKVIFRSFPPSHSLAICTGSASNYTSAAKLLAKDAARSCDRERIPSEIVDDCIEHVLARHQHMLEPAHAVAYLLNPRRRHYYDARVRTAEDLEVVQECDNFFLAQTGGDRACARYLRTREQMRQFHARMGPLSTDPATRDAEVQACRGDDETPRCAAWWQEHGGAYPDLQEIATQVLHMWTSASPAERNWAEHEHVCTARRNRCQHVRVGDMADYCPRDTPREETEAERDARIDAEEESRLSQMQWAGRVAFMAEAERRRRLETIGAGGVDDSAEGLIGPDAALQPSVSDTQVVAGDEEERAGHEEERSGRSVSDTQVVAGHEEERSGRSVSATPSAQTVARHSTPGSVVGRGHLPASLAPSRQDIPQSDHRPWSSVRRVDGKLRREVIGAEARRQEERQRVEREAQERAMAEREGEEGGRAEGDSGGSGGRPCIVTTCCILGVGLPRRMRDLRIPTAPEGVQSGAYTSGEEALPMRVGERRHESLAEIGARITAHEAEIAALREASALASLADTTGDVDADTEEDGMTWQQKKDVDDIAWMRELCGDLARERKEKEDREKEQEWQRLEAERQRREDELHQQRKAELERQTEIRDARLMTAMMTQLKTLHDKLSGQIMEIKARAQVRENEKEGVEKLRKEVIELEKELAKDDSLEKEKEELRKKIMQLRKMKEERDLGRVRKKLMAEELEWELEQTRRELDMEDDQYAPSSSTRPPQRQKKTPLTMSSRPKQRMRQPSMGIHIEEPTTPHTPRMTRSQVKRNPTLDNAALIAGWKNITLKGSKTGIVDYCMNMRTYLRTRSMRELQCLCGEDKIEYATREKAIKELIANRMQDAIIRTKKRKGGREKKGKEHIQEKKGNILKFVEESGSPTTSLSDILEAIIKGGRRDVRITCTGNIWCEDWKVVKRKFGMSLVEVGSTTCLLRDAKGKIEEGGSITIKDAAETVTYPAKTRRKMLLLLTQPWRRKLLWKEENRELTTMYQALRGFEKRTRQRLRTIISRVLNEKVGINVRERLTIKIPYDDRVDKKLIGDVAKGKIDELEWGTEISDIIRRHVQVVWTKKQTVGDILHNHREFTRPNGSICRCADSHQPIREGHVRCTLEEIGAPEFLLSAKNILAQRTRSVKGGIVAAIIDGLGGIFKKMGKAIGVKMAEVEACVCDRQLENDDWYKVVQE